MANDSIFPPNETDVAGTYQVWHKEEDGFHHVCNVDAGNLLAAVVLPMYPKELDSSDRVTWLAEHARSTSFGDKVIDPNGRAYEIYKPDMGGIALRETSSPQPSDDKERTNTMTVDRDESPLARVERQLSEWKANNAQPQQSSSHSNDGLGDVAQRLMDTSWQSGLTEAGKLRVLEGELDWTGVSDTQKEAVLAREVDFNKMTRDQLNFVYEDVAFDGGREVDERPARRLFDNANFERAKADPDGDWGQQISNVRDTTRNLIESVMLDTWPRAAAIVDFGLDSQRHYEALHYPIRNEEIGPAVLDAAMGHGANLTELVRNAPSNPHKDIQFHTSWDVLLGREKPEDRSPPSDAKEEKAAFESPKAERNDAGMEQGTDNAIKKWSWRLANVVAQWEIYKTAVDQFGAKAFVPLLAADLLARFDTRMEQELDKKPEKQPPTGKDEKTAFAAVLRESPKPAQESDDQRKHHEKGGRER